MKTRTLVNETHVSPKDNPELKWDQPKRFAVADELLRSDAFRSLTKLQSDIWLYALSERRFPKRKRKGSKRLIDYWNPQNCREFYLSHKQITRFFSSSKIKAPSQQVITRAIEKFMAVGLLSIIEMGGTGPGKMTMYRLENNWRIWKQGDPPCFVKHGRSNTGFCRLKN